MLSLQYGGSRIAPVGFLETIGDNTIYYTISQKWGEIMELSNVLHLIGVFSLLIYAIGSAIRPQWVASWLEISLNTGRGISEFRVAHGGGFLGLSLFALYSNHPMAYQALGWGWLGAALIRLLAYLPDRPKITPTYIASFVLEAMLGIFLLL